MSRIVEIEVQNLKSLIAAFRSYPNIAEPILQKAIMATAAVLAKHTTRQTVPFRTGRLLQSFIPRFARLQAQWIPTARYAIFVHEGTKPRTIFPVAKRALFWEGAKHPVKKVNHPGTKAQPFMTQIAERASEDINNLFTQALGQINEAIAERTNQS